MGFNNQEYFLTKQCHGFGFIRLTVNFTESTMLTNGVRFHWRDKGEHGNFHGHWFEQNCTNLGVYISSRRIFQHYLLASSHPPPYLGSGPFLILDKTQYLRWKKKSRKFSGPGNFHGPKRFCTMAGFFVTNAKLSSRQMCSGPQIPIFYNIVWTGLKARQLDQFVTQNNEVQPE